MIKQKSPRELDIMKEAGRIVARGHRRVLDLLEPGITTEQLDQEIEKLIREADAKPAFKDYRGYPASICTSINEEVVHGIPTDRAIKEGDIISVDIGVEFRNYYGDAARTHPVGDVSEKAETLLKDCLDVLNKSIERVKTGKNLYDISRFIESYGDERGYGVVRDYVGHGIGQEMHEDPQVPNFYDPEQHRNKITLKKGMVLALEPMLNLGTHKTRTEENNWTVVTEDEELSAHFEDTIAIKPDGVDVLTRLGDDESTFFEFEQN